MIALPHSKSILHSCANTRGYFTGIHVGKKSELGIDLKKSILLIQVPKLDICVAYLMYWSKIKQMQFECILNTSKTLFFIFTFHDGSVRLTQLLNLSILQVRKSMHCLSFVCPENRECFSKSISKAKCAPHHNVRLFETVCIPMDIHRGSSKFEPKLIECVFVKIKMARHFFCKFFLYRM